MQHKFQVLKSSWGIVIFIEITEIVNPILTNDDVVVNNTFSLRIEKTKNISSEKIVLWFSKAIKDVDNILNKVIHDTKICFQVDSVDFVMTDFQEEGLYCVMLEWLERRYNINVPKIEIDFDYSNNKYIFRKNGTPLIG